MNLKMRTKSNYKLTEHFSFYEFIEGEAVPIAGHKLNWEHISECDETKLKELAEELEVIRKLINDKFQKLNKGIEIGLNLNSGWRCKAWELAQGRSGNGQHPIAAADVYPTNVDSILALTIIQFLWEQYWPKTSSGWKGGFAIGWPKPKGKFKVGFVHFDIRGSQARWLY